MAMSGASSNALGGSTGAAGSRPGGGGVVGVVQNCWCGQPILALMSKSDHNPYRRYYRCSYAVSNKCKNDKHFFKWVDEAMLEEIRRLEKEMEALKSECMEFENKLFMNVQMKLESELLEKVEVVLLEAQWSMKKTMVIVGIGYLIIVACMKLVG